MSDEQNFLTGQPRQQEERSFAPFIVAGVVVLVIVGALVFLSARTRKTTASTTPDPYASQLTLSDIALSQSSNIAGSQITYVDGTITNHGNRTVDAVGVETIFHGGTYPQAQQTNLSLIRTRDPYIDIEPVSADPLKPGDSRPFRLIFDHVTPEWDQQPPAIRVMQLHFR